jgi:hypothetical protein
VTPPCLQLLCQAGEIRGKASRLAVAELICEPLQDRPADIRRFLARQPGSLRHRTDESLLVNGHDSLRRPAGQYPGPPDLASAWVTSAKAGRDTRPACPDGFEAHPSHLLSAAGRYCTAQREV